MFTFIILYLFFYFTSLITLYYYLSCYIQISNLQQINFSTLLQITKQYTKQPWLLAFIFLNLSGLPPVGFFLLKFIFLLQTFFFFSFFLQILIFINLLLGMFFYLQIFQLTNTKTYNSSIKSLLKNQKSILYCNSTNYTSFEYKFWLWTSYFLLFNIFSIFFFIDFYIICLGYIG